MDDKTHEKKCNEFLDGFIKESIIEKELIAFLEKDMSPIILSQKRREQLEIPIKYNGELSNELTMWDLRLLNYFNTLVQIGNLKIMRYSPDEVIKILVDEWEICPNYVNHIIELSDILNTKYEKYITPTEKLLFTFMGYEYRSGVKI